MPFRCSRYREPWLVAAGEVIEPTILQPQSHATHDVEGADGVVVGSALVEALKASLDKNGKATRKSVKAVTDLVTALAEGVRGAHRAAV